MKIPTKHINTKHVTLAAGAVATIVGLSAPVSVFAHGGDTTSRVGTHSHMRSHHSHHQNWRWHNGYSSLFSAKAFAKENKTLLNKYDAYITKHHLNVENGSDLRQAVSTDATNVENQLTKLQNLRHSIGDLKNASADQRTQLRTQSIATFEAYYDYKMAVYDYRTAIETAADSADVKAKLPSLHY